MLILLAIACSSAPDRSGYLPKHVAMTLEFEDGQQGTLLADLVEPHLPPVVRISENAWVFRDGIPVPASSREPLPGAHADGPGAGFGVELEDGTVHLELPHDTIEVAHDVERIVEVAMLPEVDTQAADLVFKSVRALHAAALPARIDGDLEEWTGRSLPVDQPAQIQGDAEDWAGPRDGSMAVATRVHHGRISLAVRLRDDQLLENADRLEVLAPGLPTVSVPVGPAGPCEVPPGWECAWVDAVSFGTGIELSMPDTRADSTSQQLDIVVRFVDVDPNESPTTIATAPSTAAVALFGLYQRPGPSGSGANSRINTTTSP